MGTGFSKREVTGDLVQTSQGNGGYKNWTRVGRGAGGCSEKMQVCVVWGSGGGSRGGLHLGSQGARWPGKDEE